MQVLEVERAGLVGRRYEVRLDGGPLTTWQPRAFGEGGSAELRGRLYELRRSGWRRLVFTSDGRTIGWAERRGLGRSWTLAFDGAYHELDQSLFRSAMALTRDGAPVGAIRRTASLRGKVVGELSPELSPPLQLFVVVVAMAIWDRGSRARASGDG
jgi:hypothetical protein